MQPSDEDRDRLWNSGPRGAIIDESKIAEKAKLYEHLFSTRDGREILLDLMSRFKVFSTTTVPGDPHASAYNEGMRSTVIYILEQCRFAKSDPSFYIEQSLGSKQRR